MNELIEIIQQIGFPIAVAIFLLWRYDKRLKDLTEVLHKIATTIEVLKNIVEKGER